MSISYIAFQGISMPSFQDIKIGNILNRRIGHNGPSMRMIVVHIDELLLYCDAYPERPLHGLDMSECWKFSRNTGCEEDEDLGWGDRFGITGSYLEHDVEVQRDWN